MKLPTFFISLLLLLAHGLSKQVSASPEKKQSKQQLTKDDQPPPAPLEVLPEIAHTAADNRDKVLGSLLKPGEKDICVVFSSPVGKSLWQQLTPGQDVKAGQTYLAMPGCRGDVQLQSLKLTLWGSMPEIVPFPPLLESMVDLHQSKTFAADLTLQRGRIFLTAQTDKPLVRIRFENPHQPGRLEIIDLALQGKGTEVMIDRGGKLRKGKPFYKDAKDPRRDGPGAFVGIWVLKGFAAVRYGNVSYSLTSPPGRAMVLWNTLNGLKAPEIFDELPATVSLNPPLPGELEKSQLQMRDGLLKARDDLAQEIASKPVNLRLAVSCQSADFGRRLLSVRCFSALGFVPELVEHMIDERDPAVWQASVDSVKHWMAMGRDNEYRVYGQLSKRFTVPEAVKIMELLHGHANPDTLVEYLDNPLLTLRQLAYLNLCDVQPMGKDIRYDPRMEAAERMEAQRRWWKLLHK